ncbi:MAG: hypothetical protein Q7U97_08120 [Rhodocyclaceae bacterium]|nr:hypothetical protein [Rhodocyclaceae bacterium]
MANHITGIAEFPDEGRIWRVVWFAGVAGNPRVDSEPVIEVLLVAVPDGELDPLSEISMRSTVTRQVRIGVGQLPYVSIGSIWHKKRPVANPLFADRSIDKIIDTSAIQFVSLGDLIYKHRVIPKSCYSFGTNLPYAASTQLAAIEIDGDPWAILIPVIELIRFYYASSTRLAQAFFWGEYAKSINVEKCGPIKDDLYRIHLRRWIYDSDAWMLARFHASKFMQQQVLACYRGIQKHRVDSLMINPGPFRELKCGFPFAGKTELKAVSLTLPGPSYDVDRILVLKLLRCSAPFPFGDLLCDRDNRNLRGKNAGDVNLPQAWIKRNDEEDEEEEKNKSKDEKGLLHSDGEPAKGVKPLVIDILEDRFADISGRKLIKEEPDQQEYRSAEILGGTNPVLKGFGTGAGIWGKSNRKPADINTSRPEDANKPHVPSLPASLETFFAAMTGLAKDPAFKVRYVVGVDDELGMSETSACVDFPTLDPSRNKPNGWAKAWITREEWRPRLAAIGEVETHDGVCYVLEAERLKKSDKLATLVIARNDFRRISGKELDSILLDSAAKGRWVSEAELAGYRRRKTTHQRLVNAGVLTRRIRVKVLEVFEAADGTDAGEAVSKNGQVTAIENKTPQDSIS